MDFNKNKIVAPSGATVELKEIKGVITMVYQLDNQGERIKEEKIDGRMGYLLGIVLTEKIKHQL